MSGRCVGGAGVPDGGLKCRTSWSRHCDRTLDCSHSVSSSSGRVDLWLVLILSDFQAEHQENKLCGANGEEVRGHGSTEAPWQERRTSSCWVGLHVAVMPRWFDFSGLYYLGQTVCWYMKLNQSAELFAVDVQWSRELLWGGGGRARVCRSTPRFLHESTLCETFMSRRIRLV